MLDRRRLIGAGLLAGARLTLGVPSPAGATPPPASAAADTHLLQDLLRTERLTIAVVARVLASDHLGARGRRLARQVLAAEQVHAGALQQALHALRAPLPAIGPVPATALDRGLAQRRVGRTVEDLHSEHDCLDLLLSLESIAEGALYAAMSQLADPGHQRLAAELLASEAEHEALLGLLREPKDFDRAAPYAFVEGIRP